MWSSVGFYQLLLWLRYYMHCMTYSTQEMRARAAGGLQQGDLQQRRLRRRAGRAATARAPGCC